MIVTILLGVVSLVVLVAAFLASKVWHWGHVTALVLFYFASVGYALLAARSLEPRSKHQNGYQKQVAQLEEQSVLNEALERGATEAQNAIINKLSARDVLAAQEASELNEAMPGANDLEHQLRMISRIRGRVWRFVQRGPVNPETSAVTVGFPIRAPVAEEGAESFEEEAAEPAGPPPAVGLEPDAIVYVFQQGPVEGVEEDPAPNGYIGEFRVSAVQGREAILEPLDQLELDDVAQERLLESNGPWMIYETMPADSRDLFAALDEDTLRRLMPAASVEEYLRDGGEATPDDPAMRLEAVDEEGNFVAENDPERKAVRKLYRRRLRDYAYLLNDFERERAGLIAREQALTADIASLNQALADAEKTQAYRREERAKWQADLDAVERERRAIETHEAALKSQVATARKLLDLTLQENARLAAAQASSAGALAPLGSGALDIDAL